MPAHHDPQLYARSFADVYDRWYSDLDDPAHVVAAVSDLQTGASVLELGSGSGRLAGPLASAGHRVIGLDASIDMLRGDRSAADRVCADMAALPLADRSIDVALVAWNTFFNLSTLGAQQRCLSEVARVLRPRGHFAIEAFIADQSPTERCSTRLHPTDTAGRLLIVTEPLADDGLLQGLHLEVTGSGIRPRPWRLAYRTPEQLDAAAAAAGLTRRARHSDWKGTPPVTDDARHVSWYVSA